MNKKSTATKQMYFVDPETIFVNNIPQSGGCFIASDFAITYHRATIAINAWLKFAQNLRITPLALSVRISISSSCLT